MCDFENNLPRSWQMFTMAIAHFNSAANPILYGIFNSNFRKGYSKFLRRIFFIKNDVSTQTVTKQNNTKNTIELKSKFVSRF
jgi:hypothetical protein